MALPSNDHHVHSDGYRSDHPTDVDPRQHAEVVLDEIDNQVHPDNYSDLRIESDTEVVLTIEDEAAIGIVDDIAYDYGCEFEFDDRNSLPAEARLHVPLD